MPGIVSVNVGTLDDCSWVTPAIRVWAGSKQTWVATNDDLGVFQAGLPAN